jgi:hypothetical protein
MLVAQDKAAAAVAEGRPLPTCDDSKTLLVADTAAVKRPLPINSDTKVLLAADAAAAGRNRQSGQAEGGTE